MPHRAVAGLILCSGVAMVVCGGRVRQLVLHAVGGRAARDRLHLELVHELAGRPARVLVAAAVAGLADRGTDRGVVDAGRVELHAQLALGEVDRRSPDPRELLDPLLEILGAADAGEAGDRNGDGGAV